MQRQSGVQEAVRWLYSRHPAHFVPVQLDTFACVPRREASHLRTAAGLEVTVDCLRAQRCG